MTFSASAPKTLHRDRSVFENLIDEITNKLQAGTRIDLSAYAQEYPEHATLLRQVVPTLEMLAVLAGSVATDSKSVPPGGATFDPLVGVLGDFRILREVGRGGMGVVYEAEQISLGRRVALKVLPFAATMDARHLQRFQNEARAAASLEHPHIVPVYGVGCERGVHYYAMKFIDGQSLAEMIHRQRADSASGASNRPGPDASEDASEIASPLASGVASAPRVLESENLGALTPPRSPETAVAARTERAPRDAAAFRQIAEWGIQAALALEYAHSLGIIHRDIKPANLLIENSPPMTGHCSLITDHSPPGHSSLITHHSSLRLWITDFGLARTAADAGLTMTGDILGTLRYMSPEQVLGKPVIVDHRADIYSLGATLYELLTLEPAFGGGDRQELLRQIASEDPCPPRRINKSIPHELETIVLKAMEKSPTDRYATAKEIAEDLRRFLGDVPIKARRPSLLHRTRKWCRRHQTVVWSAASVLGLGLLMAITSLGIANQQIAQENERIARERDDARAQRKRAREAVDTMYTQFAEKWLATQPGMEEKHREFLIAALDFYKEFAQEESTEPEHLFQTAMAYYRVGKIQQLVFGPDAKPALAESIRILEELLEQFPGEPRYMDALGVSCVYMGFASGNMEDEEKWQHRAVDLLEKLVNDHPTERVYRQHLVGAHTNLSNPISYAGRWGESEMHCRRAIEVMEAEPSDLPRTPQELVALATGYAQLAVRLEHAGRLSEAFEAYDKSISLQLPLAGKNSGIPDYTLGMSPWQWRNFGGFHRAAASLLRRIGKPFDALPLIRQSISIFEGQRANFPKVSVYYGDVQKCYELLGRVERDCGHPKESERAYKEALRIAEEGHDPKGLAGFLLSDSPFRDPQKALELFEKDMATMRSEQDIPWKLLALARYRNGKYGQAVEAAKKSKHTGGDSDWQTGFIQAMSLWQLGEKEKARQSYHEAARWLENNNPHDEGLRSERDEAAALLGIKQRPLKEADKNLPQSTPSAQRKN